jgi:hypothetical protein
LSLSKIISNVRGIIGVFLGAVVFLVEEAVAVLAGSVLGEDVFRAVSFFAGGDDFFFVVVVTRVFLVDVVLARVELEEVAEVGLELETGLGLETEIVDEVVGFVCVEGVDDDETIPFNHHEPESAGTRIH